ncbi:hypothetical protein [Hoeflea poritis]|uniref:Uncharacterized protein n=1 Tax=Hoeflea poritis TaxID=2993659 RepID=A0ABT4VP90_9HYPH|nr:hypothetical protein [Hoeflea poritis]MDA4845955.1 hypothetical protein [Hoeflea poritis]
MVAITINSFVGEQPRIVPRNIPNNASQNAQNTRLDDGALTPIRTPQEEHDPSPTDWSSNQTIFKHGSTWYSWAGVVNAAPGPVATDRLYFTGDGVPKMKVSGTDYNLAVSRSAVALTATLGGVGSGDVTTRVYVYTYVTDYGEESEPNPASNEIDWQPGNTVTLSGFEAAPAGRNITKQRIYRSQTGQTGTYFYLIAERTASASNFVDNIAVDAFQEVLPSADWNTPPDTLTGLTPLDNGMMAAFTGNKLYFCEPYHPHAWPEKYVLTFDYPIVAVRKAGPLQVVMTEGTPYLVTGTAPENMQSRQLEYNAPCINARGVVDLGYAIAYPTHEGLVVVDAGGGVKIATRKLFKKEDWLALSPSTIVAAQLSGQYAMFYDTTDALGTTVQGGLFIDTVGEEYLSRFTEIAKATFFDRTASKLYYLDTAGKVQEFDGEQSPRHNMNWRSKEFVFPLPVGMAAIMIDADSTLTAQETANIAAQNTAIAAANAAAIAAGPVRGSLNSRALNTTRLSGSDLTPLVAEQYESMTATIYADGQAVATISETNKQKRLPSDRTARKWVIDVFGTIQIQRIAMASRADELRTTP